LPELGIPHEKQSRLGVFNINGKNDFSEKTAGLEEGKLYHKILVWLDVHLQDTLKMLPPYYSHTTQFKRTLFGEHDSYTNYRS